ncbi:HNH endonuclease signature motif containing protein [Actinacidiphila acididurans]|uniref:HNH endonuclease n=1 Tax=Actinacidiphila acididurans TaxID=2784346 RepID=A0ABS2TZM8_9ACTN|nr:HNH endonuclease [Actinacidiphila acididurans]MBM9508791.1 HNH endonuclease [Actinacidiphila acididurans]
MELDRAEVAAAVAGATSWAGAMRALGMRVSGGGRRALQRRVTELGLDTGHFARARGWRTYSDEALAEAAASARSLLDVARALGATPAPGTLSHLSRRLAAAGIDVSHFPAMGRDGPVLPFTAAELAAAAARCDSVRAVARALGVPDDGRTRAALGRMLRAHAIGTAHFRHARAPVPEAALRAVVPAVTSYAEAIRALGLAVDDTNHRRLRRAVARLGVDTGHFARPARRTVALPAPRAVAAEVLVVRPPGSPRLNRARLHRALAEVGTPYRCATCGNTGQWRGRPLTLHIDHVSGDWLDNRRENLRYLCPNCHALTGTWGRGRSPARRVGGVLAQEAVATM